MSITKTLISALERKIFRKIQPTATPRYPTQLTRFHQKLVKNRVSITRIWNRVRVPGSCYKSLVHTP